MNFMKNLRKIIKFSIITFNIVFMSVVISTVNLNIGNVSRKGNDIYKDDIENIPKALKESNAIVVISYDPEIEIDGDATYEQHNWSWAVDQSWCSGSGTLGDPYIIEGLSVVDSDGLGGCLEIRDTQAYFIIQNCEFKDSIGAEGIYLSKVSNGNITNNNLYNNAYSIRISTTNYCNIQDNTIENSDRAVFFSDSFNNTVFNNNIKSCDYGVYIDDCYNITAKGNSMISCGIYIDDTYQPQLLSHKFDKTNTINGRILYYYKNKENLKPGDFANTGQVILVNCSNAVITKVNVSYASQGISLYQSDDNLILNNNATHNEKCGIYVYNSINVTIFSNNVSSNNENGISVNSYCEEFNITNNEVNDNAQNGIYLYNTIESNITNNKIKYNQYSGIYLQYTENITLANNEIILGGLTIEGSTTKKYYDSHKIDTSNTINGDILYYYSKERSLDATKFSNAGQVILISCNDSIILDQNVSQVTRGFEIRWCKNITIINCNSSLNDYGLRLIYSNWCNLSNCVVNNNSNDGIMTTQSNNNHINNNEVNFNYQGIPLDMCSDNVISDNFINDNYDTGIALWGGSNNTVINNTLNNNQEYGIYLDEGNIHNLTRNSMFHCGVYIECYDTIKSMVNNSIDDTNKVNGKPLFYYINKNGLNGNDFINAGQVILINCSYATIRNLNLTYGTVGLMLYLCENSTITRINSSFNSQYGLIIGYSCKNNVTQSLFKNNGDTGLLIYDIGTSMNNLIFTNAFIENGFIGAGARGSESYNNAAGGNISNKWDNGSIGNYWNDYDGKDKNDNGIGDTPYLVTSYESPFPIPVYDNFPIWDDGPERLALSADEDGSKEEKVLPAIPFGNYYLIFLVVAILSLIVYYKKRKL